MESGVPSLRLNSKFNSYAQFENSLKAYEEENNIQLWKRDARKIEKMQGRAPNKKFNTDLIYAGLKLCCVHGGKNHKSTSSGLRPKQSTFKQNCPVFVQLSTTPDGSQLVVTKMFEEHNHETNVNLYKYLPRQRQLSGQEKAEVEVMMTVNANKKMVQQHIKEKTGKHIVLKDLHNIQTGMKKRKITEGKNDIEIVNEILTKSNGGFVEYLTVENELKALFFQDSNMRSVFTNYPEVVLVDATYKTNNLRMPLYVILNIDGNGQSEIVALFLLAEEDEALLTSVIDLFKKHNPAWEQVKVILTDKDMTERNVLTRAMPQASLQLCLFHVLRNLKREITPDKLGITVSDKFRALEILQKIAYCKTEDEYTVLYGKLCENSPNSVVSYYNKCWHNIRTEWVDGLKNGVNLGNRTNNRIESINEKIKSVVNHYLTLPEFAENLLIAINFLRTERDHKIAKMFQKRPVSVTELLSQSVSTDVVTDIVSELISDEHILFNKNSSYWRNRNK